MKNAVEIIQPAGCPMVIHCPECHKKLKVPDNVSGKKLRCPGCKKPVVLPAPPAPAAPPPPAGPPALSAVDTVVQSMLASANLLPPVSPAGANVTPAAPASTMRCAGCKTASLQVIPANLMSRRPGYLCTACGKVMRRPGTTAVNVFVLLLGVFIFLLALLMTYAVSDKPNNDSPLEGAAKIAVLGVLAIAWAVYQLRLPIPLDAPVRPVRYWLWALVLLVIVLIAGGGLFFVQLLPSRDAVTFRGLS